MTESSVEGWAYPFHVAHRGAGKLAPENTMAAMRLGASLGYRMFEFDVKLSADGVPVLMHDATLDRTTNGRGPAAALSLAELKALDAGAWHSAAYAGERIPTLAELSEWMLGAGHLANIEIKPSPGAEASTGRVVALAARELWQGATVAPLLSSFSEVALAAAREVVPELPRALLCKAPPVDWLDRCRALGCVAIDPDHRSLSPRLIETAHQAGLKVLSYTINDPARARMLASWGLDCLITDRVDQIPPGVRED